PTWGAQPPPPPGSPYGEADPTWGAQPPPPPPATYPVAPAWTPGYYPPAYWAPSPPPVRHTLTRRNWVLVVVVTAVIAGLVGAVVGAVVGANHQQTVVEKFFPNQSVLTKPTDIQAILSKVEPSVVSIDTTVISGGGVAGNGVVEGAGTGMIITPDGQVLTNNHVVAGATNVTVTLFGQTAALSARVIGTDPAQDLALVQINDQHGLPTVTLGDSNSTLVGDDVLAIGNALALAGGPSVTEGIVSAKNRNLSAQSDLSGATESLSGLLQTDAPINPGNSGGPLVNSTGQVVGMNTAVASSSAGNAPAENVGFAIAIDTIKPKLSQLRAGGTAGPGGGSPQRAAATTAYIGVVVETVTPALARADHLTPTAGALVTGVNTGGPADKAGIKAGEVIVSLGGQAVTSSSDLVTAVRSHHPGDTVSVVVFDGSTRRTVSVVLASQAAA
ncbi:MAG TPA: trypsin-like peptidase domain-containing protein, partial [Acidimicrobiales bacterium]|nr:trypsin-like peptidase domain-containing protein [Acidimicrobiales bacterium]